MNSSIKEDINPNDFQMGSIMFGRCKWFNSKTGYGFITFKTLTGVEKDVFVHHKSINVSDEKQYKYLIVGEYIQFKILENDENSRHKYYAAEISGINGGKLMCETRQENRIIKSNFSKTQVKPEVKTKSENDEKISSKKSFKKALVDNNDKDWSVVSRGKSLKKN